MRIITPNFFQQELDYDEFKLFIFAALDAQAELEDNEQKRLESSIRNSPWVPDFMKATVTKLLNR